MIATYASDANDVEARSTLAFGASAAFDGDGIDGVAALLSENARPTTPPEPRPAPTLDRSSRHRTRPPNSAPVAGERHPAGGASG